MSIRRLPSRQEGGESRVTRLKLITRSGITGRLGIRREAKSRTGSTALLQDTLNLAIREEWAIAQDFQLVTNRWRARQTIASLSPPPFDEAIADGDDRAANLLSETAWLPLWRAWQFSQSVGAVKLPALPPLVEPPARASQ